MTSFEIVQTTGMMDNTTEQISLWDFGKLFVIFGITKMIVVSYILCISSSISRKTRVDNITS